MKGLKSGTLKGLRFGVNTSLLKDSIYKLNIEKIRLLGGIPIEFNPEDVDFNGFGNLLSADMRNDLPNYLNKYASDEISLRTMKEIVVYNKKDSSVRIPYGQARFEGASNVDLNPDELLDLKNRLHKAGIHFFESPMVEHQLDAVLSIDNRNAGYAAAAKYPCLTIPMGYTKKGQPTGLTFITRPFQEDKLLEIGYAFEQAIKVRKIPEGYK